MSVVGVFVCWCGTNIAGTVDIEDVLKDLRQHPLVGYAEGSRYLCSETGQEAIIRAIHEYKLSRVVVGTCSPRMHEETFRKTVAEAGLNPYLLEVANLREQCAWVHRERDKATAKAKALLRAAVDRVALHTPLYPGENPVEKRALVIGGGIAGIQAALDLAAAGYPVDLVEREPSVGGGWPAWRKHSPLWIVRRVFSLQKCLKWPGIPS